MTTLLELAERCEAATGDKEELRALEADIRAALNDEPAMMEPPFVASVDAALTLVPEGWTGLVGLPPNAEGWIWPEGGNPKGIRRNAATPALAICAASLRARARAA